MSLKATSYILKVNFSGGRGVLVAQLEKEGNYTFSDRFRESLFPSGPVAAAAAYKAEETKTQARK